MHSTMIDGESICVPSSVKLMTSGTVESRQSLFAPDVKLP
jgi:hypothetical protein